MTLKFGVPNKGRLNERAVELLTKSGIDLGEDIGRKLYIRARNHDVEVLFLRAQDIPEFIASGAIDLGITGQEVHFSNMDPGILVVSVNEGSPAEAAGMKQMDIITAIDGQQVTSFSSLQSVLYSHDVGDTVTITVLRSGETLDLQVTLAEVEESGTRE